MYVIYSFCKSAECLVMAFYRIFHRREKDGKIRRCMGNISEEKTRRRCDVSDDVKEHVLKRLFPCISKVCELFSLTSKIY